MAVEIGEYGPIRQTPFRKGWGAGYGFVKAHRDWLALPPGWRNALPKPEKPQNPYASVKDWRQRKRGGAIKWDEGLKYGIARAESLIRQGKEL